jgi:hypothetical protein
MTCLLINALRADLVLFQLAWQLVLQRLSLL